MPTPYHKIVRVKIFSTDYKLIITLPKETSGWRIVNEGATPIRWADNDRPPDAGDNAWSLINGGGSDAPPLVPAHERKPISIYARTDAANQSVTITIIYTTSQDPSTIANIASAPSIGTTPLEIDLGAVELRDASGDQRVTITSGPDGIKFIETDVSGSIIYAIISSDIEIGSVELKDGSGDQRVTITSGTDGIKYIETDVSGSVVSATISGNVVQVSGQGVVAIIQDGTVGSTTKAVVRSDATSPWQGVGGGNQSLATLAILHGRGGANLTLPITATSGQDGVTYIETDVSGSAVTTSISGNVVQISGQAIAVSGQVIYIGTSGLGFLTITSGSDGVKYVETDVSGSAITTSVSGNVVQISGQAVTVSGNIVQVSGQSVIVYPSDIVVGTGIFSFTSGAALGATSLISIPPPATRSPSTYYVVAVFHTAVSSDVSVRVNDIRVFGDGVVRRPEITRFAVNKGISGISQVVQGMFPGGATGEIAAVVANQAAQETFTGNVVVVRI